MKKTIWKFPLVGAKTEIQMPKGAEILTVQTQYGNPVIWALVNPNAEKEARHFEIFGTGQDMPADMAIERTYIGTFQVPEMGFVENKILVFHLFERIN